MSSQWIDFKQLRTHLRFADVLKHYGVTPKRVTGSQFQAVCPLKTHGGEKRSATFSANLSRGIWQCFSCGATGNALDLAVRLEGLSPDNTADVRTTALRLQRIFRIEGVLGERPATAAHSPHGTHVEEPLFESSAVRSPPHTTPTIKVNEPLDFELKGLQTHHPFLTSKGILPETIQHFGLGYANRGLMAGRIVIPLHASSRLVGYSGRIVDDAAMSQDNPKYKFPSRREHKGVIYEFDQSRLLYNAHRITGTVDHLIVVEWFPAVWWLWQAGIENTVALMGSTCSKEQAAILLAKTVAGARISVVPDATDAASRCAHSVFAAVGLERWAQWVRLPSERSPTECEPDELKRFLRA